MSRDIILRALILMVFLGGCATVPYVRSDIFVDSQAVKSIYIMPIATEVTLDSAFDISREELQVNLQEMKEKIKNTLESELARRGYRIGGYSREFHELDQNNGDDRLIRLGIQEFLHSTGRDHDKTTEDFLETLLEGVFPKGELTVTDENGKVMNPLVTKTLDAKKVFPNGIDTVLYMEIKSFIAKRGLWKSLQEKSTVNVRIKLVHIDEKKIIFSYQTSQDRSDILHWKSLEKILSDVLGKIPVKLEC